MTGRVVADVGCLTPLHSKAVAQPLTRSFSLEHILDKLLNLSHCLGSELDLKSAPKILHLSL